MDTVRDKQAQTILDTVFKEGLFKEKPNVKSQILQNFREDKKQFVIWVGIKNSIEKLRFQSGLKEKETTCINEGKKAGMSMV